MDPLSIGGLAIGVASISLQVYTGCIQGIQLLLTALGYDEECKYLTLRLRLEQHRLFAWSEASGLVDVDTKDAERILSSNILNLHRQTILELLLQIQYLFKDFTEFQRSHKNLAVVQDDDGILEAPERDAKNSNFPLSDKRRIFIRRAMKDLKSKSQEGWKRLKWASFDKPAFEMVLTKFSHLNNNMYDLLDHSLQLEIKHTVEDTNRGVLLLHRKINDLSALVLALKSQLDAGAPTTSSRRAKLDWEANASSLGELAKMAKFKAFNETISIGPNASRPKVDKTVAKFLELAQPGPQHSLLLPRECVLLDPELEDTDDYRCQALLKTAKGEKKVWIEWKDYDGAGSRPGSLTKDDILDRVGKLAALLNHTPKPGAFRTPHCLGLFDKADPVVAGGDVDILDQRLGLVFERPGGDLVHASLPPVSLRELLHDRAVRRPRVTERVRLAHALANCLLYLHAVNWLHKGLRSHNIIFFRDQDGQISYRTPFISGFDFSRPGNADEMTDAPCADAEHDLYRHPGAQSNVGEERQRSRKSFDIYSLGVVFVEIAHWKTIEDALGIDMRRSRNRPEVARRMRGKLLDPEHLAEVGSCVGEKFEEATRRCIAGNEELGLQLDDEETADDVAQRLSMRFYEDVVKSLGSIIV